MQHHNHVLVIFYYHACMYSHIAGSIMFQLVGDNVDLYQKPRIVKADHKTKTYHWFQVCAVTNHVKQMRPYYTSMDDNTACYQTSCTII